MCMSNILPIPLCIREMLNMHQEVYTCTLACKRTQTSAHARHWYWGPVAYINCSTALPSGLQLALVYLRPHLLIVPYCVRPDLPSGLCYCPSALYPVCLAVTDLHLFPGLLSLAPDPVPQCSCARFLLCNFQAPAFTYLALTRPAYFSTWSTLCPTLYHHLQEC